MNANVLLVEDNPGDARLAKEIFGEVNDSIHLLVAVDGIEAMAFLKQEGIYIRAPRPDFILLDLNLPKMDGREVLAEIKRDNGLKTIPTIILTTSKSERDIFESYELQANSFVSKPARLEDFEDVVRSINDFWLARASLPRWVNHVS